MTYQTVLQIISSEIGRLTETPAAEIEAAAAESVSVLGIDSLDLMELTASVETRLGVGNLRIEEWLNVESRRPDGYSLRSLVEWCLSAADPVSTLPVS